MGLGAFDPHPHGCPIGLRVRPSDMTDAVVGCCVKLQDVLHAGLYVIRPSRGQTYPVLFLSADAHDRVPRVALFPGWEDDRRSRPIDWGRQCTLLQRIHEAGTPPESPEQFATQRAPLGPSPLLLPLASAAGETDTVIRDLFDRLGALLRMTVTRVPQPGKPDLVVVRVYVLDDEKRPRIVLYPGWTAPGGEEIDHEWMEALLARVVDQRLPELPVEAVFDRG